jgi:hypothetical protein
MLAKAPAYAGVACSGVPELAPLGRREHIILQRQIESLEVLVFVTTAEDAGRGPWAVGRAKRRLLRGLL